MTDWLRERVKLGRTGLLAGPLGIGASYRAPAAALEAAFEEGCNYFYWGALRFSQMAKAIRHITAKGKRDELVVVIQDFRRTPRGVEKSLMRGLRRLDLDYADVLLLGWHKKPPEEYVMEACEKLREKGAFRYLGISGHTRSLFPLIAKDPRFGLFHIRYNAANRGAEKDVFPQLPEDRPGIVAFTATRRMSLVNSRRIPAHEKRPTAGDCYRFVLSHPAVDVVITGPSKAGQLEENMKEMANGPMTDVELDWMRRIGDSVYGKPRK